MNSLFWFLIIWLVLSGLFIWFVCSLDRLARRSAWTRRRWTVRRAELAANWGALRANLELARYQWRVTEEMLRTAEIAERERADRAE